MRVRFGLRNNFGSAIAMVSPGPAFESASRSVATVFSPPVLIRRSGAWSPRAARWLWLGPPVEERQVNADDQSDGAHAGRDEGPQSSAGGLLGMLRIGRGRLGAAAAAARGRAVGVATGKRLRIGVERFPYHWRGRVDVERVHRRRRHDRSVPGAITVGESGRHRSRAIRRPAIVARRAVSAGGGREVRHLPLGRRRDRRRDPRARAPPSPRPASGTASPGPSSSSVRRPRPARPARPAGASVIGSRLRGSGARSASGRPSLPGTAGCRSAGSRTSPRGSRCRPGCRRCGCRSPAPGRGSRPCRGRSRRTSCVRMSSSSWKNRARPMSRIFTTPARSTRMLPGLMSRWTRPISWACWSPTAAP